MLIHFNNYLLFKQIKTCIDFHLTSYKKNLLFINFDQLPSSYLIVIFWQMNHKEHVLGLQHYKNNYNYSEFINNENGINIIENNNYSLNYWYNISFYIENTFII